MHNKSATRVVQVELLAMQFVATVPIIIQALISDYSTPKLLLAIGFMLTAINFFHGKVATLDDTNYYRTINFYPKIALADFFLNTFSVMLFLAISCIFTTNNLFWFILANIILRFNDSILVLLVRSISSDSAIRKAQMVWLSINIFFITISLFVLYHYSQCNSHWNEIAIIYFFLCITDVLLDYVLNRGIYFTSKNSWGNLGVFWDNLQGLHGDLYRQKIILPYLLKLLTPIKNKKILDIGCGNGCLSRFFEDKGGIVTAVDKFDSMLNIAKRYNNYNIQYLQIDLDNYQETILVGDYDIIVACFSLQDCNDLSNPFKIIEKNLSSSGRAIVIFENKESFESERSQTSTTSRMWMDSAKKNGLGRRQMIFWEARAILVGQGMEAYNKFISSEIEHQFATITHYWSQEKYIDVAKFNNLTLVKTDILKIDENKENLDQLIVNYIQSPKFNICIFKKENKDEQEN